MIHARSFRRLPIVAMFPFLCVSPLAGQDASAAPPRVDTPYTAEKSDPVTHQVDFSVVVTPPYECRLLRVWLPIPQSDTAQQVNDTRFTTFPLEVQPEIRAEPVYGNRFAYFEFHNPRGAQIIRHRFQVKVWTLNWDLEQEKSPQGSDWPEEFTPYLKPQQLTDKAQFHQILRQIVPKCGGARRDLESIMQWIDGNLTYTHVNASLQADANHALARRCGHCSDYHGLCATMGRALGYPTRVTYGLALFPKNSPSHCKVEVFFPAKGWVSFDLSETQKMVAALRTRRDLTERQKDDLAAAAYHRLRSGFRENSWVLLTKGTNYELAPKASAPVPVVRTAYVEADGEPLPDPDPANKQEREFSWMTVHKYEADRPFPRPFKDLSTLSTSPTSGS